MLLQVPAPCRIDLYPTAYLRLQKWHFTIRCHTGPICSSTAREIRRQRCTGTSLHACYHITAVLSPENTYIYWLLQCGIPTQASGAGFSSYLSYAVMHLQVMLA